MPSSVTSPVPEDVRALAERLFGDRLPLAERFAGLLAREGVERGLIGPREVDRLWQRHILNCALMVETIPAGARTLADVGSGAGLPGVVIAIARPDLEVTLIETMLRRATWLEEVEDQLGLGLEVVRSRAEDLQGDRGFDVVTARAVAALDKLVRWTLPLVAPGGHLVAMKGSSAAEEIEAAAAVIKRLGGVDPEVIVVGEGEVEVPTTVVRIRATASLAERAPRAARTRSTSRTRGAHHGRTVR